MMRTFIIKSTHKERDGTFYTLVEANSLQDALNKFAKLLPVRVPIEIGYQPTPTNPAPLVHQVHNRSSYYV